MRSPCLVKVPGSNPFIKPYQHEQLLTKLLKCNDGYCYSTRTKLFTNTFLILPRQCTYFCLAAQMALLGFIFIERERKSLYENSYHLMPRPGFELTSVACTTLWDLNSGPQKKRKDAINLATKSNLVKTFYRIH